MALHPSEKPLSLVVNVQHIRCWYDTGSGGVGGSILCLLVGQIISSCYSGVGRDVDQHCRLPRREVLYDDVPVYCTGSTSLVILETSGCSTVVLICCTCPVDNRRDSYVTGS